MVLLHLPEVRAPANLQDALLTGSLEQTKEWYAIAKMAGIKMCQAYRRQHGCDFISAQPPISTARATTSSITHGPTEATYSWY